MLFLNLKYTFINYVLTQFTKVLASTKTLLDLGLYDSQRQTRNTDNSIKSFTLMNYRESGNKHIVKVRS